MPKWNGSIAHLSPLSLRPWVAFERYSKVRAPSAAGAMGTKWRLFCRCRRPCMWQTSATTTTSSPHLSE